MANENDNTETQASVKPGETGPRPPRDVPAVFKSYIYKHADVLNVGLGGDAGGRPGALGGPPEDIDPELVMYTFAFIPPVKPERPSIEEPPPQS